MKDADFMVQMIVYSNWRLKVRVNGKRYIYREVSPWTFEHFNMMLRFNKGKALAFLKGQSIGKEY